MKDFETTTRNMGIQFFAEPTEEVPAEPQTPVEPEPVERDEPVEENAEVKRLKAELAKQKQAIDNATKDAANWKRQARALQSEDERRKAEQEELNAARDARLAELEKQAATSAISKRLLTFLPDEKTADEVASALYGSEDTDAAIDAISKAWAAKEKSLRLEYSKIPAPGTGEQEGDAKDKNVEFASQLGATRSAALKGADNGLKRFAVGAR